MKHLLVAAAAMVALAAAPVAAEETSAQTYLSTKAGVAMQFPKDWMVRETANPVLIKVWGTTTTKTVNGQPRIARTADSYAPPMFQVEVWQAAGAKDAAAFMASHTQSFTRGTKGYKVLAEADFKVAGLASRRVIEAYPAKLNVLNGALVDMRRVVYTVIHGGRTYMFVGSSAASTFERNVRLFDAMVKTVKFH